MVISDLHLDDDPVGRVVRLSNLVVEYDPEFVISLGDLGVEFDYGLFVREVLGRSVFRGIYGNHDNVVWMQNQYNFDGSRVLLEDGGILEVEDLRLGFINGIISVRRRSRKGVPRKFPEEFRMIARKLAGKIDVLCMHEFPVLDELMDRFVMHTPAYTARESVQLAHPKLVLCGHIHYRKIEPKLYHIGIIREVVVDSTAGYYVLLDVNEEEIKLMKNGEEVFRLIL